MPMRLLWSGTLKTYLITQWLPWPVQLSNMPGLNLFISRAPHLPPHPYLFLSRFHWRLHNLIASLNFTKLNSYQASWEVVLMLRKNSCSNTIPPILSGIAYFHKIWGHPDPFQTSYLTTFTSRPQIHFWRPTPFFNCRNAIPEPTSYDFSLFSTMFLFCFLLWPSYQRIHLFLSHMSSWFHNHNLLLFKTVQPTFFAPHATKTN